MNSVENEICVSDLIRYLKKLKQDKIICIDGFDIKLDSLKNPNLIEDDYYYIELDK